MKTAYLAGAMSKRKDFGARWRKIITPWLLGRGYEPYNPVLHEGQWTKIATDGGYSSIQECKELDHELYSVLGKSIEETDVKMALDADIDIFYIDDHVFMSDGTLRELYCCWDDFTKRDSIYVVLTIPWKRVPCFSFWRFYDIMKNHDHVYSSLEDLKRRAKI